MRDPLSSPIADSAAAAAVAWSRRRRAGRRRGPGLVQLLLGVCCALLLLIGSPAVAASSEAIGAPDPLRPRGTPTQQLDDEAMPELQLFDSAGAADEDGLLPPLGPMGGSALGGDLFGD